MHTIWTWVIPISWFCAWAYVGYVVFNVKQLPNKQIEKICYALACGPAVWFLILTVAVVDGLRFISRKVVK